MTRYPPQSGYDSHFTQKVVNNLPDWHVIRMDTGSVGHGFVNGTAIGLGELDTAYKADRRNAYLPSASTLIRWDAYRATIPASIEIPEDRSTSNLLYNSAFQEMGPSFRNTPLEWIAVSGEMYSLDSFRGGSSVLLQPANASVASIHQDVIVESKKSLSYTASVYLKIPVTTTTVYSQYTLGLTLYHIDGSTLSSSTSLPRGTVGQWQRVTHTIAATGEAKRIRFDLTFDNDLGYTDHIRISAPQLEEGTSATEWKRGPTDEQDALIHVEMVGTPVTGELTIAPADPVAITSVPRIALRETTILLDSFEDAIPTRVVASAGDPGLALINDQSTTEYTWNRAVWRTRIRINSGTSIEKYFSAITGEVSNISTVLDRYIDNLSGTEEFGYLTDEVGFSRTLEALTVYRDRIYIVAKETFNGATTRSLKVVKSVGLNNRLEVIGDVRIDDGTSTCTSIAFVDGHIETMRMERSDGVFTLDLSFDNYFVSVFDRQVILRHAYSSYTPYLYEL